MTLPLLISRQYFKPALLLGSFLFVYLSCNLVLAHGTGPLERYVADSGVDQGQCLERSKPCLTIGFAVEQSGKGDSVLVASGSYPLSSAQELFFLTSQLIPVYGGYTTENFFLVQNIKANQSVLIGIPAEYRAMLAERGFSIISDGKSLSRKTAQQLAELNQKNKQLQRSEGPATCNTGFASTFPCNNINLLSHLSLGDFSANPVFASDIWGHTDLNTMKEYALIGLENGVSVVDVTDGTSPVEIGHISGSSTDWRDIKVYQFYSTSLNRWNAYAYATSESNSDGFSVIDLNQLPDSVNEAANLSTGSTHNIYIGNVDYATNTALPSLTPYIYLSGTSYEAFEIYQLNSFTNPSLLSQQPNKVAGDYMHDATSLSITESPMIDDCINATSFCDLLFDFNEAEINIWDTTDKSDSQLISSFDYPNKSYTHSGWLTEDNKYLFVNDEIDEIDFALNSTIRVFQIDNLSSPVLVDTFSGSSAAIDHNGFVKGNRYYFSNYERGISVLDITDPSNSSDAGYFDTYPLFDSNAFNGAWGVYPYLPSGNIIASDINSGLYVLSDQTLDNPAGTISLAQTQEEFNEGQTIQIAVQRNSGSTGAVSVDFEIIEMSLLESEFSSAYTNNNGQLNWSDSDSSDKMIQVDINSSVISEFKKMFMIRLLNPQGGASTGKRQSFVNIIKPGLSESVFFSTSSISFDESEGDVAITVTRFGKGNGATTLGFISSGGSAIEDSDFSLAQNQISWLDGEIGSKTFNVSLLNDTQVEEDETFTILLQTIDAPTTIAEPSSLQITITNDDSDGSPSPPDDDNSDPDSETDPETEPESQPEEEQEADPETEPETEPGAEPDEQANNDLESPTSQAQALPESTNRGLVAPSWLIFLLMFRLLFIGYNPNK